MREKIAFWHTAVAMKTIAVSMTATEARAAALYVDGMETSVILMMGAFAAIATGVSVWAVVKLVEMRRRARLAEASARWNLGLLNAAPGAFIAWNSRDEFICSARLAQLLGFPGPVDAYRSLSASDDGPGFNPEDFSQLSMAITRFKERGENFASSFRLRAGARGFSVQGVMVPDRKSGGRTCVIWFTDVTALQQDLVEKDRQISAFAELLHSMEDALDTVSIPMWRRGADLKLEWANAAYVRAVEAPSREAVVEKQIELLSGTLAGGATRLAEAALKSAKPVSEKHYVVIGGQRRSIEVTCAPGPSPGQSVIGFAVDVTEADEIRAELTRYNESHAETLNKLSTAVAIFGSDKKLEYFNSAFAKLWKLPEDLLLDHPHHSELLEMMRETRRLPEQADFPAWKREHMALYTDLIEPREEMWYLPDASTLRVVFQPHPLGGLLIFFEDVTDHLALERSYNTLFAVQRATLNNLHEAVAVFGSDGRLKLHNSSFAKVWQLSEDFLSTDPHVSEIVSRCATFFDEGYDGEAFGEHVMYDESHRVVREARLPRADGSVVDFTSVPLPDGAMLLTYLDVTDTLRIERALRERNEALVAADRLKTEFIAHVSYNLRTPLNSVIGFAELLNREYYGSLNVQQRGYTRNILESSGQLMLLINDIIDLSVISAGRMELELSEVDLGPILVSAAAHIREEARSRNLRVDLELPERLEPVAGDVQRIKQVLYNLTGNALKFTPPGGKITLGASCANGEVQLFVADTGVGIPAEQQGLVFDPFETGNDEIGGHGGGLGLSLVRRFVELHGGRVELESVPGEGTRVNCIFRSAASSVTQNAVA